MRDDLLATAGLLLALVPLGLMLWPSDTKRPDPAAEAERQRVEAMLREAAARTRISTPLDNGSDEQRSRVLDRIGALLDAQAALAAGPPPAELSGEVTHVDPGDTFDISLGSEDGIARGHELIVFRGARYVAMARVAHARPGSALARLLPDLQKDDVRVGDEVMTSR